MMPFLENQKINQKIKNMNPLNVGQRQIQPKIDIKSTTPTLCEKCEGEAFQEAIILRRVSAIVTGTGKDGYLPVQVFACVKCGHVNSQFLPDELRSPTITS